MTNPTSPNNDLREQLIKLIPWDGNPKGKDTAAWVATGWREEEALPELEKFIKSYSDRRLEDFVKRAKRKIANDTIAPEHGTNANHSAVIDSLLQEVKK